ncbi:hypothetical protein [Edaphovirga cremea]|uniref:hypothetical protein n=1 Tax=Edaphovirga cremea TaxID=2267246 RepID=UPI003988D0A7
MSDWIYPEIVESLKKSCSSFLGGEITVQDIQTQIYMAENQIVALDEKWLRTLLFNAENEIELLIYTTDESQLFNLVKPVVQNILSKVS